VAATKQDRVDVQVFTEIGLIEHLRRESVNQHLPEGLGYSQFEMLRHFARHGDDQTPAELAEALIMTKGAITNTLQRLEAQGYVSVLDDAVDRRRKRVRITEKGVAAYNQVMKDMRWKFDALRGSFTDSELRQALPFLRGLRAFLEDVTARPAPSAPHR
jgi:DNA-binding MarR family transcriptional regulator